MSMTLQQMRDFVRTHADADTDDAPDSSLDIYARIAYFDILSRRFGWPHLAVAYTFTSVVGQADYPFSGFSSADMDVVSSVSAPPSGAVPSRLIQITRTDADYMYGSNVLAYPNTFLISNDTLTLFPSPTVARTYTVRGFRNAAAWPNGAASTPDLPESMHEAICWYMLSNYFMAQEDAQLAGVYLQEYEQMVRRNMDHEMQKETATRPLVMGGQNIRLPYRQSINW